jgi:hypothetical protein
LVDLGRFLISPLGPNFDLRGWSWPPGVNFVPYITSSKIFYYVTIRIPLITSFIFTLRYDSIQHSKNPLRLPLNGCSFPLEVKILYYIFAPPFF